LKATKEIKQLVAHTIQIPNVDMRVSRDFAITERYRFQILGELSASPTVTTSGWQTSPTPLLRLLRLLSLATWLGPLRRFVLAHPLGR
jgi:hypothetical protein